MLVAIPTAIPDEPLTIRFGSADGRTTGSSSEVRQRRWKDDRLFERFVEVGLEVDGVPADIGQHLLGQEGEPRLGVSHRGRAVAVDRAEVALPVDELVAHVEILRHANERVVNGRVAVRVVFTHRVADDAGALAVRAPRADTQLAHRKQDAPVDGLEAVAHIGQRARNDDAHRVVDERLSHLGLDVDRDYRFVLRVHKSFLFFFSLCGESPLTFQKREKEAKREKLVGAVHFLQNIDECNQRFRSPSLEEKNLIFCHRPSHRQMNEAVQ